MRGTIRDLAIAKDRLPATYEFGSSEPAAAVNLGGSDCELVVPLGRN